MRAITDYHTHTVYSHGRGTIEDNVRAAIRKKLKVIGITDHGPGHFFIGVRGIPAFWRIQGEISRLRRKYPQIEILFGVEANIVDLDGTIDVPRVVLRELDILLVGYHKTVRPGSFPAVITGVKNIIAGWTGTSGSKLRELNTKAITAAVRRYAVDVITHPGLQVDIDTGKLAQVCSKYGTALEINSSYGEKLDDYILAALPSGVKFVINSDAHTPSRVGDFAQAYALVERVGVPRDRITNLE